MNRLFSCIDRWCFAYLRGMGMVLFCSDAPDMTAANTAAASQAAMSQEQLAWAKQIYAEQAPDRAAASQTARDVSDRLLTGMDQQNQVTSDYITDRNTLYRPLEASIVADANAYDTPERRAAAMQTAGVDAERAIAQQREASARALEAQGVNPGSGKNLAMTGMLDIGAAKVKAGAENMASRGVETVGRAMKMDAAQLGRGNASAQATSAGLALNQGTGAVNTGMQPLAADAAGNGIMTTGYSGAQAGMAGAANTYTNIANIQQKASDDSGLFGALGQVGGAALMMYSDKNLKTDVRPLEPDEALDAVNGTPINTYTYKPGTVADDGGQAHAGGMAQDMKKTMGPSVSNGKKVNIAAEIGVNMAATKALSRKIDKIAAAVGVAV